MIKIPSNYPKDLKGRILEFLGVDRLIFESIGELLYTGSTETERGYYTAITKANENLKFFEYNEKDSPDYKRLNKELSLKIIEYCPDVGLFEFTAEYGCYDKHILALKNIFTLTISKDIWFISCKDYKDFWARFKEYNPGFISLGGCDDVHFNFIGYSHLVLLDLNTSIGSVVLKDLPFLETFNLTNVEVTDEFIFESLPKFETFSLTHCELFIIHYIDFRGKFDKLKSLEVTGLIGDWNFSQLTSVKSLRMTMTESPDVTVYPDSIEVVTISHLSELRSIKADLNKFKNVKGIIIEDETMSKDYSQDHKKIKLTTRDYKTGRFGNFFQSKPFRVQHGLSDAKNVSGEVKAKYKAELDFYER